jgi:RNA polymerase sigma-70 factor (ECF subfamily)
MKRNPPPAGQAAQKPRFLPPDVSQERLASLIRQVAQNLDRGAFATLFDVFAPQVKSLLMRRGLEAQTAEDVMQDVLLTVWTKAGLYDPARGSLRAWVFTIARNAMIDRLRKRTSSVSIDMIEWEPVDETESAEQGLMRDEQMVRLRGAMSTVSREQLDVLRLAFEEELTQSQIAEKLGLPLGTVKSRMRLAYAHLRGALEGKP